MNKRDDILEVLVNCGWSPNIAYLNDEYVTWYWIVDKSTDKYGKFFTMTNNGEKDYSDYNYLISPQKKFAITVKEHVITVHEAKKKYSKVITFDIDEIEITDIGLKCNALMLLFND